MMLQRANAGHLDAVQSCLQTAFARKGKLRDKRVNVSAHSMYATLGELETL